MEAKGLVRDMAGLCAFGFREGFRIDDEMVVE